MLYNTQEIAFKMKHLFFFLSYQLHKVEKSATDEGTGW